jgi:hypothetical protein
MEASQRSLLAACFTLHSVNATLAIIPQRGAGLWIFISLLFAHEDGSDMFLRNVELSPNHDYFS